MGGLREGGFTLPEGARNITWLTLKRIERAKVKVKGHHNSQSVSHVVQ